MIRTTTTTIILSIILILIVVEVKGKCALPPYVLPRELPEKLPQTIEIALKKIEALLDLETSKLSGKVPSVVVGIAYNQRLLYSKGFGKVNTTGSGEIVPSPSQTLYPIASVTKVFTALLMLQMRDEMGLDLDAPLRAYLPGFSIRNPYFPSKRDLTLRALSSHLAGLPRNTPCQNPCNLTNSEMLARIAQLVLVTPPYTAPMYSNLGFSLLGHALSAVGGASYQDLIEKNILAPLGMTNSAFNLSPAQLDRVAQSANPFVVQGWDVPAGGLYSTADDMVALIQLILTLTDPQQNSGLVLDGWSLREWTQQQLWTDPNGIQSQGMPWENRFVAGQWTNYKGGSFPGYTSGLWIAPDINLGFFVSTTSGAEPFLSAEISAILFPAVDSYIRDIQPRDLLPPSHLAFVGNFVTSTGASFSFSVRNASGFQFLALDVSSPPFPMLRFLGLDNHSQVASFRVTPLPDPARSNLDICNSFTGGIYFEYVYFQLNQFGTSALSLTIPGILWDTIAFRS